MRDFRRVVVAAVCLVGCGSVAGSGAVDSGGTEGGHAPGRVVDGGADSGHGRDDARASSDDGGRGIEAGRDAARDAVRTDASRDGGRDDAGHADATLDAEGGDAAHAEAGRSGGTVDAGYYFGDGSYFVDGGAYADVGGPLDAPTRDAQAGDATSGCGALSACCSSLTTASQSLCDAVAAQGNAANCSTELAELQGGGDCTGVAVLATEVQIPPNRLVSDGTLLFWTTTNSPALLSMPVRGGAVRSLLTGPITNTVTVNNAAVDVEYLAVDGANVYVLDNGSLVRIPKDGGGATLVNEAGARVFSATSLGDTAYWVEVTGRNPIHQTTNIKSAPLSGGAVSLAATFTAPGLDTD
jgi:hypothetical protein